MNTFGKRLKLILKEKEKTQEWLANEIELGGGQGTVARWLRDTEPTEPKAETIRKICKVLNVSSDYLLGLDDKQESKDIQFIMEYTGLSEESIKCLNLSKDLFKSNVNGLDIVLSSNSSFAFLEIISKFLTNLKVKDYVIEPEEDSGLLTYQEVIGIEEIKKVYLLQIMTLLSSIDEVTNKTTEKTTQQLLERLERIRNGNDTKKE